MTLKGYFCKSCNGRNEKIKYLKLAMFDIRKLSKQLVKDINNKRDVFTFINLFWWASKEEKIAMISSSPVEGLPLPLKAFLASLAE